MNYLIYVLGTELGSFGKATSAVNTEPSPKPRKEFFVVFFAALSDVDRNKCILVGDSLTSDMRGAENAGITSCWFNPEKQEKDVDVRTDYEIRRLEELIPILEQE